MCNICDLFKDCDWLWVAVILFLVWMLACNDGCLCRNR